MLPHAVDRRSSDSWSQIWSAPERRRGDEPVALVDQLPGPGDELVAGHGRRHAGRRRGSSPRGRRGRAASTVPGRPSPIGAPSNDVTGRIPATLDDRKASSAAARSLASQPALERPQPDPRSPVEQPRSGRARQDRAVERGRRELERRRPAAADQEDVGRRPLGQVVVDRQEQRIVRTGAARLEPRVDVLRAGRRLEGGERVLRVAPDRGRDEVEPALEVVDRRSRTTGHAWIAIVAGATSFGWQHAARPVDAPRDRDPDRRVTVGAVEAIGGEQRRDAVATAVVDVGGQLDIEAVGGSMETGEMRIELRRATARGARSVSKIPSPSWKPRSKTDRWRPVAGQDLAVDPHVPASAVPGRVTRPPRRRSRPSGPRALATVSSHSAAGSLPQVMPPPTWSVSRRPSATNVRMRMLVCIAPSGPIQPSAPVYGPRRTGSRPSRISIARIFGRAGDRAAREARRRAGRRRRGRRPAGR